MSQPNPYGDGPYTSETDSEQVEELQEIAGEDTDFYPEPAESFTDCFTDTWVTNLENSVIPTVALDTDLVVRWRNQAFKAFRETEGLEYRGRPFHALFTTFADHEHRADLVSSLKSERKGFSWQGNVEGRGHGNRAFQAALSVIPIDCGGTEPQWYLALISDRTDSYKSLVKANFKSILQASLLKDEDTGNHVKRVNAYAKLLASSLKGKSRWYEVDDDFVEDIGFLAAFHDVGKIGTPESILLKPMKLADKEWEVMKEHPINGALILDAHPNPMAKDIARSHHEWWDGTGYPFGLAGEDIPLSGRIVAVADVYDALRTRRPYKMPFNEAKAVSIIKEEAGTHFDPYLIEVFLNGLRKKFDGIFTEMGD